MFSAIWNSLETITRWNGTLQMIAATLGLLLAFLTITSAVLSKRRDTLQDAVDVKRKEELEAVSRAAKDLLDRYDELKKRSGEVDVALAEQQGKNLELEHKVAISNKASADAQLALERYKAWRVLDASRLISFRSHISALVPQSYSIAVAPAPEPIQLANAIDSALQMAGWQFNPINSNILVGGRFKIDARAGIHVQVSESPHSKTLSNAEALIKAFLLLGLRADIERNAALAERHDLVHIVVGTKEDATLNFPSR